MANKPGYGNLIMANSAKFPKKSLFGTGSAAALAKLAKGKGGFGAKPVAGAATAATGLAGQAPIAPIDPNSDAGYQSAASRLLFQNSNALADLKTNQTRADADHTEALRRLAIARTGDLEHTDQNYNKMGLFYSGQLGKARGGVESDYTNRQSDIDNPYNRSTEDRTVTANRIQTGQGLDLEGLKQEAVARIVEERRRLAAIAAGSSV